MFTVVAPTTSLSLDDHFIKRPAATFFVTVEGGGMAEHGILAGDTLIVDRSRTPGSGCIVMAAIEGELTARLFAAIDGEGKGAVTVTGWCQLRVASSFLL